MSDLYNRESLDILLDKIRCSGRLPQYEYPPPRKFIIDKNGCVIYEKDSYWEPPNKPYGFTSDPNNMWRFIPNQYSLCKFRLSEAYLKEKCGCLDFSIRCISPECPLVNQTIKYTDCEVCKFRSD